MVVDHSGRVAPFIGVAGNKFHVDPSASSCKKLSTRPTPRPLAARCPQVFARPSRRIVVGALPSVSAVVCIRGL